MVIADSSFYEIHFNEYTGCSYTEYFLMLKFGILTIRSSLPLVHLAGSLGNRDTVRKLSVKAGEGQMVASVCTCESNPQIDFTFPNSTQVLLWF